MSTEGAADRIDDAVALVPAELLAGASPEAPAENVVTITVGPDRTIAPWEFDAFANGRPAWHRLDLPGRVGGWSVLVCHAPQFHGVPLAAANDDTVMWIGRVVTPSGAAGSATEAALGGGGTPGTSSWELLAYGDDVHGGLAEATVLWDSDDAVTLYVGSSNYESTPGNSDADHELHVYARAEPASTTPGGGDPDPDPGGGGQPGDEPPVDPVPVPAPAAVQTRPLRRVTPVLAPRPALVSGRPAAPWHVLSSDDADLGVPHLFIAGVDVTWWRDVPVSIDTLTDAEPFGDGGAQFTIHGVTALDTPGAGDLAWLRTGVDAEVWLVRPDGSVDPDPWWTGLIISLEPVVSATDASVVLQASGALFQADQQRHRVPLSLPATDVGTIVARVLNAVVGRRYAALEAATTGITTTQRGGTSTTLGYVTELLASATTGDGASQWTVKRVPGVARRYALAVKDRTTIAATFDVGQPGLVVTTLVRDATAAPNVLYGSGVAPDGYGWAGWAYPNLRADDAPAYPMASASQTITVGTTDAQTATGSGVSTWQRRMVELGHRLAVDGTFDAADRQALLAVQRAAGLSVDGVLGPQSWASTFDVGSNAGSLDGAIRLPLAFDPRVEPLRYGADGGVLGPNPAYDPSVLRVESDTAYGAGITKADATRSAAAELARLGTPGWVGSLTLTLDPPERSRFTLRGGDNVLLRGWAGTDLVLHVAGRTIDNLSTVTLTVDSHARDLLTVAALVARDAETAADVARRPGKLRRTSQLDADTVVAFDGESGAGRIPRVALFAGLWTVLRIPVSQAGRISRLEVSMVEPVTRFSVALFGAPITPAQLNTYVGDPLNEPEDGALRPYVRNLEELEETFAFVEAFGAGEAGAGYYPGNPGEDNPVTGKLVETAAIEYVSSAPPWLWVALYSPTSTFASGRIYPAPQGT